MMILASKTHAATKIVQILWEMGKHYKAKQNFTLTNSTLCVSCDLPRATVCWNIHNVWFGHIFSSRAKTELNEEVTRYLQDFPEEMKFHTSNLHLLDSVGQGKKMCGHVCCMLERQAYMHFGQYQASSAVLGWPGKGGQLACLINMVDVSISKIVCLHIAVLLVPKMAMIVIDLCWWQWD